MSHVLKLTKLVAISNSSSILSYCSIEYPFYLHLDKEMVQPPLDLIHRGWFNVVVNRRQIQFMLSREHEMSARKILIINLFTLFLTTGVAQVAFGQDTLARRPPPPSPKGVPELSVNAAGSAAIVVLCGLMVIAGRRRKSGGQSTE
jgi:hypothetical protein